ncbi:hypothetical protein ASE25_09185 [Terrabacter sp. Root85]|uniref:TetR/AcrR family transcriptional regulator n=1 Tax=unclassified Terrabacter TaxID=2630222 RepID=UPI0006FA228B|nr:MULTISPECIES: TetR/AcrR family transcriptional regulator [unclassified Terrabacter]KRC89715.1 hypothetical protein ASE25_09185 [Terrabacter sp. Root85]KRF41961.1 hypothetical protein ASH01_17940 [Terrabacter sp. Soil811]
MTPERGRPRDPRTDDRIAGAALELLREHGPGGVHIDAVSSRSGVARTTIYRRYRDRGALLAATLEKLGDEPFPAPELPLEDKLRWVLEQARTLIEEQVGRGGVATVLAGTDPDFSAALQARIVSRLKALQGQIDADIRSGRIRSGTDAETLAGLAFGACLGELLQHGRVRRRWADSLVPLLLHGTKPRA